MNSSLKSASGAPIPVRLFTLHLDHATAAARAAQAREVASASMVETDDSALAIPAGSAFSLPIVAGGDFNSQPGTDPLKAMTDFGFVESSGSATTTRIDHVFAHRSAPFAASSSKTVFTGPDAVSDHPGVIVALSARPAKPVRLTRVVANGSLGTPLTLRGDRLPLTWDRGWPAFARPSGKPGLAIVMSELAAGPFAYKFLRNDVDWQTGANVSGAAESDNATTPSF